MRKSALAVLGSVAFAVMVAQAEVTVSDGVMTIPDTGNLSELLTPDQIAMLTGNSVTNVIVDNTVAEGGTASVGGLLVDVSLQAYQGSWEVKGKLSVNDANGLGSVNAADESLGVIRIIRTAANRYGQLFLNKALTVDKPVFISGSDDGDWRPLYANQKRSVFARKVTVGSTCRFHFQGGEGWMTFNGGLDATGKTINTTGANGHFVINNVPCSIGTVAFSWVYLDLYVAGNEIHSLSLANAGGKVVLYADGALSAYPPSLSGVGSSCSVSFNGHDAAFGKVSGLASGGTLTSSGGAATMSFTNATDLTVASALTGDLSLEKHGAGKLTLDRTIDSTGKLKVCDGEVEMAANAVWSKCSGVTLDGGKLTILSGNAFSAFTPLTVADADAQEVVTVADGVSQTLAALVLGTEDVGFGLFGGAASSATTKLDCFSKTATGIVCVNRELAVAVPSGSTLTIGEALTEQQLAALNDNAYSLVKLSGDGTLVLDQALDYTGAWDISCSVKVTAPQYAFGKKGFAGYDGITFRTQESTKRKMTVGVQKQTTYVEKPITVVGSSSYSFFDTHGYVHFTESQTWGGNEYFTIYDADGKYYVEGGLTNKSGNVTMTATGGSRWYVDSPMWIYYLNAACTSVQWDVPGNHFNNLYVGVYCSMTLNCDNPFENRCVFGLTGKKDAGSSQLYLNGHDMTIGTFQLRDNSNTGSYIESMEKPATIDFVQAAASTNTLVAIRGNISFVKGGDSPWATSKSIEATGSLTVTGGVFALVGAATWTKCTNVVVRGGTAVVELNASGALAPRVDVSLSDGGKLDLGDVGTVQTAGYLVIDGALRPGGTWGSSASAAENKDDVHFSGAGILDVRKNRGTLLLVR